MSFSIPNRRGVFAVLCTALLAMYGCNSQINPENLVEKISEAPWQQEQVASGVLWKSYHFNDLFGAKQNINILYLDKSKGTYEVSLVYSDSLLFLTSTFGGIHKGIVAINGSFFDMEKGGSFEYLKSDNKLVNAVYEEAYQVYKGEAAFAIDSVGTIEIVAKKYSGYYSKIYTDVLASGPLLISEGKVSSFEQDKFNNTRNPRTAIGKTIDNHLLLVTVDGRTEESQGLSISEMALLMKVLNCTDALNLDGGGSTTMWIKNKPYNGVVNNPSDNKKFDNKGQRPVANAIVVTLN